WWSWTGTSCRSPAGTRANSRTGWSARPSRTGHADVAAQEPTPTRAPERERVVLADIARERGADGQTRIELRDQTGVGDARLRGLLLPKLILSLRLSAGVVIGLGGLPLLFAVAPTVAALRPFGVSLPWLLLGVAAYPFLVVVGWAYVALTERTERDFT